jgi:apolipoprotein N-acyltransferase
LSRIAGHAREAAAVLSGVLLFLSFPKFGSGVVAWVALVPLLAALPGASGWRALRLGYLTGAVSSLGLLYWTALVVTQFGGLSLPVSVAIMAVLCLVVALFPALVAWLVGRWVARLGVEALLAAPVAWVAVELARARTFLQFPWCLLGYSQHEHPAFVQVAAFTAVYGVSFLLVLVSAAVAYAIHAPARKSRIAVAAVAAVVAGAGLYGTWALAQPIETSGTLRVGLVQASIRQDEKWAPGLYEENVRRHVALTRRAAGEGARLVVWPESAVPFPLDRDPGAAALLRETARESNVFLLFGNDDYVEGANGKPSRFVGAKLLSPVGELGLRYHKMRLVPFGEYVPLQPLFTLGGRVAARLVEGVADFSPGREPVVGEVEGTRLAVFICYEAIFPDLVRRFVAGGADLLVNVTNDAWYGLTSAPFQHFAMARFRAVESGKYLVRAANTGISGVVDPRGRVVAPTALFEPAALVRDVPIASASTFYARHGDVFAWACALATLALAGLTLRRGDTTAER